MLLFCTAAGSSDSPTIPIKVDLAQAIVIALKNNTSIRILEQDFDASKSKIREVTANRNPDIDIQLGYRYLDSDVSGDEVIIEDSGDILNRGIFKGNVSSARLNIDTKLLSWRKNSRLIEVTELQSKLQELTLKEQKRNIIRSVIDHYYTVLVNKKFLESTESQQRGAVLQLEQAGRLYSNGKVAYYDVLRARVQKSNIESLRLNREVALTDSINQLRIALGVGENVSLQPVNEFKAKFLDLNQEKTLQQALENRIEIQKIDTELDIDQKTIKVERSGEIPDLSAFFQSDLYHGNVDNDRYSYWVGFNLIIPLSTGTTRDAKLSQARNEYTKNLLKKDELIQTTKLDLSRLFQELRNLRQVIEIQKQNIEFAREGLRVATLRYESGNGTSLEVIDSRAALAASETEYFQSVKSSVSAIAELGSIVSDDPTELLNY